jgi:hypothetical protein
MSCGALGHWSNSQLDLPKTPKQFVTVRLGIRLGEGIETLVFRT